VLLASTSAWPTATPLAQVGAGNVGRGGAQNLGDDLGDVLLAWVNVHVLVVAQERRLPFLGFQVVGQPVSAPADLVLRRIARITVAAAPLATTLRQALVVFGYTERKRSWVISHRRAHRGAASGDVQQPAVGRRMSSMISSSNLGV